MTLFLFTHSHFVLFYFEIIIDGEKSIENLSEGLNLVVL